LPLITNTEPDDPVLDDPLDTATAPLDNDASDDDDDPTCACDAPITDAEPPALVPTPARIDTDPPSEPEPPIILTDPAWAFLPVVDPTEREIDPDSELVDDDDIDPVVRT
jgi:hypothetical protein